MGEFLVHRRRRHLEVQVDIQAREIYLICFFSRGCGFLVRDIWEWTLGFYTEFRYQSYELVVWPGEHVFENVFEQLVICCWCLFCLHEKCVWHFLDLIFENVCFVFVCLHIVWQLFWKLVFETLLLFVVTFASRLRKALRINCSLRARAEKKNDV